MKTQAAWQYLFAVGITLTAIVTISASLSKAEPNCLASPGQIVVKWKDQYWPCKHWWSIRCRRKHSTYKVTLKEGIPLRNENGAPIAMAGGKIRTWAVYDSAAWNSIENHPRQRESYPDYETIADNEYVVMVETRYWLFHNVEANLRICTQKPQ